MSNDEKLLNDIKNSIKISKDFRFDDTGIRVKDLEDILDLINRLQSENAEQKAEIERLAKDLNTVTENRFYWIKRADELQKQVKQLEETYGEGWAKFYSLGYDKAVKDTAKEIIAFLTKDGFGGLDYLEVYTDDIKEIEKRYIVEVE